jgi:hypothetical protein
MQDPAFPKKPDSEKLKDDRSWKSEKPTQFDPYKETAAFWIYAMNRATLWMVRRSLINL